MQKSKIIFFLGNGFSQGFGFPSFRELWKICLDPQHERYKHFLDEAKNHYPLNFFIKENITDIELLLTIWKSYSEAYEEHVNAYKSGRGYFENYVNNLCAWLYKYTVDSTRLLLFNEFMNWFRKIESKYQIIFLTTNYDLLIEKVLLDCSISYHHVGIKTDSIPIRKFHGSLSWFSASSIIVNTLNDVKYTPIFGVDTQNAFAYDFSAYCFKYQTLAGLHTQFGSQMYETNVTPLTTLIPPVIGKKYGGLFNSIFSSTVKDFEEFDSFVIIGYSFPESDPIIRDKIISIYRENFKVGSKLVYINNDQSACDRVDQLFEQKIEIICDQWNLDHIKCLILS